MHLLSRPLSVCLALALAGCSGGPVSDFPFFPKDDEKKPASDNASQSDAGAGGIGSKPGDSGGSSGEANNGGNGPVSEGDAGMAAPEADAGVSDGGGSDGATGDAGLPDASVPEAATAD